MSSIDIKTGNLSVARFNAINKQRLGFILRFFLYTTLGMGLLYLVDEAYLVTPFCIMLAELVGLFLKTAGLPVIIVGQKVILAGSFGIDITLECSGIPHFIIFLSGVMACRTTNIKRFYGLFFGALVIFMGNLIRLVVLFLTGLYAIEYFDFVHFYVFGGLSYAALILMWVLWLRIFSNSRRSFMFTGNDSNRSL